jgi:serine/threonine protein kinase
MKPMAPPPDRTATLQPRDAGLESPEGADADDPVWPPDDPDRYEPISEHARGGLGKVVRAIDHRLNRTVAVKQLLRHDEGHEQRFVREALITARLQHPGIVPVHEAGRWPNGEPYYVMKLVEGRTLKELVTFARTLHDRLALLPHVIAISDAIAYAHSEGVIHRDLKPANVVVGAFGETVVVDWGLALDRDDQLPVTSGAGAAGLTSSGSIVGTPAYMPPEQARGEPVDARADVYALGAVLYELLAGAAPYSDSVIANVLEQVIAGPPTPLHKRALGVPHELAGIVAKAMARDREDRYVNASAFADDLRRYQTGRLVSAHAYSPWQLARKKIALHPRVARVVLAGVLALSTFAVRQMENASGTDTCHVNPMPPAHVGPIPQPPQVSRRGETPCHGKYVMLAGSQTVPDPWANGS